MKPLPTNVMLREHSWQSKSITLLSFSLLQAARGHQHQRYIPCRTYGNGPLNRYGELRVAHARMMLYPPPTSKESASLRSRHASRHLRHVRAMMHVGIANPRWRGKRSRHSRRMRNPQFFVSGKRSTVAHYLRGPIKCYCVQKCIDWVTP